MKLTRMTAGIACGFLMMALGNRPAVAEVNVGDKPKLHFKAFGGSALDLNDYKGKIVVVDFWATWCGPCMHEAPHMVEVNEKYAGKGLQFIGISLDEDASALKQIIKAKNFTWPMSFEGKGWEGSLPKTWGVTGIPCTFIIGPEGDVLWRGHPANIDQALADAFEKHPPQLVDPKVMDAANKSLDEVETLIKADQSAKALKALATVPEAAKADAKIAERIKGATDQLQDFGKTQLAAVDQLIAGKQYVAAAAQLRDLQLAFAGTSIANTAQKKLKAMNSDPQVRMAIEADRKAHESTVALAAAKELAAQKHDEEAYPKFKAIAAEFPGTPAAAEAAGAVKAYESNTAFITAYRDKAAEKKASAALTLAENYKSFGSIDKAKAKYQEVLDQYPNTKWAEKARSAMAALPAE